MTKPVIVTRAVKGSALTHTEGDSNLTNLQDATIAIKAGTGGTDVVSDLNGTVTLVAGSNITITGDNTAKTVTIDATGGGSGITDLVQDLSPQLGGALDVNGQQIVSSSNGNIAIVPNGTGNIQLTPATGKIILGANDWPTGPGSAGQVLTTAGGTGALSWETPAAGSSTLDGLSDVTINTPTLDIGDALVWDGSVWLNGIPTNATNATNAGNVGIASTTGNTADTLVYLTMVADGTATNQPLHIDTALSYNASTNVLTAAGFSGTLTGNASSATNATNADNVALTSDTTNALRYVAFAAYTANGDFPLLVDTGFSYNPSTNALSIGSGTMSASSFSGSLNGATSGAHNGSVGATTPNTGAFTTLSASSTVSGTGFSTYLATPPAIGGTTSNTGDFTTLTVDGGNDLRLNNTANTFYVGFKAGTLTASKIWTLPTADGTSNQVLTTNGAGVLSWGSPAAATALTNITSATSGTRYLAMTTSTSGSITGVDVQQGSLQWEPNTEILTATYLKGALKSYREPVFALTYAATLTPDIGTNGNVQKVTLTGNVTISAFISPVAGQSCTLILVQDATGSRTLTSTMKFAGGLKTLSTAANSIDILSIFYDGTNYYASLGKGFV